METVLGTSGCAYQTVPGQPRNINMKSGDKRIAMNAKASLSYIQDPISKQHKTARGGGENEI